MKGILSRNGKQMRGPIPEGMWGFDANAMQYSFDEAKAKAALEKVNDKPASLTFLYSDNDPNWEPIALSTQASPASWGLTSSSRNWRTPPCATASAKVIMTLRLVTGARTSLTRTCS